MVIDAHMHNMAVPGSYSERLNAVLRENNRPAIKFPPTNVTEKLFESNLFTQSTKNMERRKAEASSTGHVRGEGGEVREKSPVSDEDGNEILSRHESTNITSSSTGSELYFLQSKEGAKERFGSRRMSCSTPESSLQAADLQVSVFIKHNPENKQPKRDLDPREFYSRYVNGTLKYQIQHNSPHPVDYIEELISSNRLTETKENIQYVKANFFDKVPNRTRQPAPITRETRNTGKKQYEGKSEKNNT